MPAFIAPIIPAPTKSKIAIRKPYRAWVSGKTENKIAFPNDLSFVATALTPDEAAIP